MPTDTERTLHREIRRVMESIGRCLTVYQHIELQLKFLLPHIVGPNETTGDTFEKWKSLLDSKTTLGPLVARLSESVQSSDPEGFGRYVSELVAHRNELIHHFCQLPFGRMTSLEQCDAALAHLSGRLEFALPLYQALKEMLEQFSDALVQWKLEEEPIVPASGLTKRKGPYPQ
jgi:hypothetical protein